LAYKAGSNKDIKEVCLEVEGKTVLRFAVANGFRNIQVGGWVGAGVGVVGCWIGR
jgi:hypothetical protein